jgi:pilus assembly protein Flp/PilA
MFKSSISAICISFRRFVRDEGGATAIEYAMIASGVSIVIAGTVLALGSTVTDMFTSVATALN